ncbi:branched-chain amino acid transport system II carrier protein [Jeotgalibaca caeni]|uniref:branched-chain amino acid transport system II carrier protein n=1 Tax=Jeotgalibaca caeni TaxID=3028623 RepID=UPI00237ED796|nr:branched-chain amino acid transport system II carrier protein [Jeotgalibaca caeni]MDE1549045.1 branched-chain amino acid transport system II carrier protein [Jeotgalibaca caeni]
MERKLSVKEYVFIGSMLFGLFFGAGNLIFPIQLGQQAGAHSIPATLGLLVTAVGLPFLGIVAMGLSKKDSLYELASKVSLGYALFYTIALYLTIGPFFAIPRTATVSFEAAFAPYLQADQLQLMLFIFTLVFFIASLWFSLRPTEILKWIGKVLNPIFLVSLAFLAVFAFSKPMGRVSEIPVSPLYQEGAFFTGFLEGYNTMDALASLAFGIIIVGTIKNLGVTKPLHIARDTILSGVFSMLLMAAIYASLVYIGATSQGVFDISENGGVALAEISQHYFGGFGAIVLAVIITVACFKTAVGLITAISEMFVTLFPEKFAYNHYVYLFTGISFLVANLGLQQIISFSIPVLMFLYPLAIVLILLAIFHVAFQDHSTVYRWTIGFTLPFAFLDFLHALPVGLKGTLRLDQVSILAEKFVPLFEIGMGWVVPSIIGFLIGFVLSKKRH